MSFILDALRKSDARRRLNEGDSAEPGSDSVRNRRRRWLVLPMVLVVGVLLIGGAGALLLSQEPVQQRLAGLFGGSDPTPPPAEQSEPAEVEVAEVSRDAPDDVDEHAESSAEPAVVREVAERDWHQRERVVEDPEEIESELQRRAAEAQSLAETDEPAESSEPDEVDAPVVDRRDPTAVRSSRQIVGETPRRDRQPEPEDEEVRRLREAARQVELDRAAAARRHREEAAPAAETATEDDATPWRSDAAEYVRAWELPLSVRRNLPDLKLNIHVYSAEHENRFVLVNGERFVTGDQITDGIQLVDIRREGAVVDYRDYRFLLEP